MTITRICAYPILDKNGVFDASNKILLGIKVLNIANKMQKTKKNMQ